MRSRSRASPKPGHALEKVAPRRSAGGEGMGMASGAPPRCITRSRPIWCSPSGRCNLPAHAPGPCRVRGLRHRSADHAIPGFPSPGQCRSLPGPGSCPRFAKPGFAGRVRPGAGAPACQAGVVARGRHPRAISPGRYPRCLRAPTTVCDRSAARPRWRRPGQGLCRIHTLPPRPDLPGSRDPDLGCLRPLRAAYRAARAARRLGHCPVSRHCRAGRR